MRDVLRYNKITFLVNKLNIGDALVCDVTGWRVDRIPGRTDAGVYVISKNGFQKAIKVRPSALIKWLVNNKDVPLTLTYHPFLSTHMSENLNYLNIPHRGYLDFPRSSKIFRTLKNFLPMFWSQNYRFTTLIQKNQMSFNSNDDEE